MATPQSTFAELRATATAALKGITDDRLRQIYAELQGGTLSEELKPYASKGPLTITPKAFLDLVEAELAQRAAPPAPAAARAAQAAARPSFLGWLRRLLGSGR